ncbi:MAG TPA: response regulator transcription factor [Chloroflexia bacterium]|nr:response regulator transcription factor [Chloroflexia bacterium]
MRVVICDDQQIVREGLALLLKLDPEIEIAGLAAEGSAALRLVEQTQPDLVLMDLLMPGMNGVQATREIRARFPATQVLVLTTYDADEWVVDAIRAGAAGYLLKDMPREEIIRAVKGTVAGQTYLDPAVAGKVIQQVARGPAAAPTRLIHGLSEREVATWRLLARGRTNAEIAADLHLSEGTVRNQVSSLLAKLQVADRTQAAVLAWQHGLGD